MAFGQAASANCFTIDPKAAKPLAAEALPPTHACHARMSHGFPIPDPTCSPGATNPTITVQILRTATQPPTTGFRTSCLRDKGTSAHAKAATYDWYGVLHPARNTGANQTCELDHIISLELGGADTLDNIWPECGPPGVALNDRYFKQKDLVENYLADQVRTGAMTLEAAQIGIATDWTKYRAAARAKGHKPPAGANP
jgi:5-methylcytosine-specific restriction endonuclease McrA